MRSLVLAAALLLAGGSVQAQEARWAGAYLGGHLGYGWGTLDVAFDGVNDNSGDLRGIAGGAYAGWNAQFDAFVVGLEADIGGSGARGEVTGSVVETSPPAVLGYKDKFSTPWGGHLRLRAGYAFDDLLLYAAGGLAVTQVKFGYENIYARGNYSWDRALEWGWSLGAGLELALGESFALRAEYLYDDYGEGWYFGGRDKVSLDTHTLRLGIAYRF